jgi:hypothetical protein
MEDEYSDGGVLIYPICIPSDQTNGCGPRDQSPFLVLI